MKPCIPCSTLFSVITCYNLSFSLPCPSYTFSNLPGSLQSPALENCFHLFCHSLHNPSHPSAHSSYSPGWLLFLLQPSQVWEGWSSFLAQRRSSCYIRHTPSLQVTQFLFLFFFLGLHLWHVEVPRLGVKSELQMLAYATATAMQDLSHVCDLHQSSQQCLILNPLSEARDPTYVLMDTSWVCYHWARMGTPRLPSF